jgi:hypothetical protein
LSQAITEAIIAIGRTDHNFWFDALQARFDNQALSKKGRDTGVDYG